MVFGLHRFTGFPPSLLRFYRGFRTADRSGASSRKKMRTALPFRLLNEKPFLFRTRGARFCCIAASVLRTEAALPLGRKTCALSRRLSDGMKKNYACRNKRNRGAGGRTRTGDLLITNQLLYQLSHTSASSGIYCIIFSSRCQGVFLFFLLFLRNICVFFVLLRGRRKFFSLFSKKRLIFPKR